MSWWTRIVNAFGGERLNRELDEEMRLHIEEAMAAGRSEDEARRAFGNVLLAREHSRDVKVLGWLEAVISDIRFGARQLRKNWVVTASAVLSLALAIGACTGAFRLIDAMMLRPLPVAEPERLHYLTYSYLDQAGVPEDSDSFTYPLLREMRSALKEDATLLAISYASRIDITYGSDAEMEKAYRQYVSGEMFPAFGLNPTLGRLLGPEDDGKPGAHPVAVLSYDYWTSRFGRDPGVLGRKLRIGEQAYDIVGIGPKGFTGTETGTMTGIFVPATMNSRAIDNADWAWFRLWVKPSPWLAQQPLRDRLQAIFTGHRRERIKGWGSDTPRQLIEQYLSSQLVLNSASRGASRAQRDYGRALTILGILVALVLLIACANVANLLAAQTAARSREMALRVSIGAGRWRLVQLILVESAMLAAAATGLGAIFAWWSAPWVASRVNPPDQPLMLSLPADWRVLGFAAVLATAVTLFFGLIPALRAGRVEPASALKGGETGHSRLRLIHGLVAGQIAFCFVVHFAASLFVASFERLTGQPLGFTPEGVIQLETVVKDGKRQPAGVWEQVAEGIRAVPGVESAAVCGWALMSGNGWSGGLRVPGRAPDAFEPYFLAVSPGFLKTMAIQLRHGRDFTAGDGSGSEDDTRPAAAIVSESFARRYFGGANPVGRYFDRHTEKDKYAHHEIVGLIDDVRYRSLREPVHPVVFVPAQTADWATFAVRVHGPDPLALAPALRNEATRIRSDLRVTNTYSQRELVDQWSIRERLLATLSIFFSAIALLLASIGLYGVLNYSVMQRTREIGIRMALGAPARHVAMKVTARVLGVFVLGAAAGLVAGVSSGRVLGALLYSARTTEPAVIATPLILLAAAALLAAIPPVIRAIRIDPARALRAE